MSNMGKKEDSSDDSDYTMQEETLGGLTEVNSIQGLASMTSEGGDAKAPEIAAPRIDTCRFSMANLEETPDVDLDAILGELCALDLEYDEEIARVSADFPNANEGVDAARQEKASLFSSDNDSAFSDTVSMLSTGSSASSNMSSKIKALGHIQPDLPGHKVELPMERFQDEATRQKTEKIHKALERSMRDGDVKKLFMKAFTLDGSSKSLLIDDKMTCGRVVRLLADKNHVVMDPKWAIVEHLTDLCMERIYEDHENMIDNIMLWTRDSKNKIIFAERPEKTSLFETPERFLLPEDDSGWPYEQDEHSRRIIIDEFFAPSTGISVPSISGHPVPPMEGPLYMKTELKKWKKYYFVLRNSGLYYSPKERVKAKELVCVATFETNEVYLGVNWRKKYKSPTDHCFAIKHPKLQQPKSLKYIKFLCAEDQKSLDRWINAMRIAKHGRQLLEDYRSLVEDLTHEDIDHLAQARSCSITSIPTKSSAGPTAAVVNPSQSTSGSSNMAVSETSSGRHSRASSSSSSGCLSDGGTASENTFDSEFPMGTIKRKPSMKPNIPLTWTTRQLKEMAEGGDADTATLTRRPRNRDDSTLKRNHNEHAEHAEYSSAGSGSPAHTEAASSGFYEPVEYRQLQGPHYACPDPDLPPPPALYSSTTSLESLPPPPSPAEPLDYDAALPPPPPDHDAPRLVDIVNQLSAHQIEQAARAGQPQKRSYEPPRNYRQQTDLEKILDSRHPCIYDKSHYREFKYGEQTEIDGAPARFRPYATGASSLKKVCFEPAAEVRKPKKITFNLDPVPSSPKKPPPPKRNESTRLSSPKRLADSACNPPRDFLTDLQRVMRKKWQVAEKCKLEPEMTPHEVLGFREYPLLDEYKEASVSMWVQEHYGQAPVPSQIYQNVYMQYGQEPRKEEPPVAKKRPPPAPPRRSESTQLSTQPPTMQPLQPQYAATQPPTVQPPQAQYAALQPPTVQPPPAQYAAPPHYQPSQSQLSQSQLVAMLTTEFGELNMQDPPSPQPGPSVARSPPPAVKPNA